jgi:hypothetical protein
MSPTTSRPLAGALAGIALALQATALVLMIPNSTKASLASLGFNGVGGIVLGLTYPVLGWLITSRRPGNPIGWIFLVIGLSQAGTSSLTMYAYYGLVVQPGAPLADVATWAGVWWWVPGYVLLFVMVLVFPDGTLPSRRWRPVLWLAGIAGGLSAIPIAIGSWGYMGVELMTSGGPSNPSDPLLAACATLAGIGNLLILPVGIAALAGIIVRFRRSGQVERLQIRWFALAAAVEVGLLLLTGWVTLMPPFDILAAAIVVPLVPIATAVAILRYRLYELDRIISRTIAWTLVTAVLVGVLAVAVVGLQGLLDPVTNGDTLAVAGSTLIAAAMFQPLRRRIQRAVDRRFDRARVAADGVVTSFGVLVRNEVDLPLLRGALVSAVDGAVRPEAAGLWLKATAGDRR